MGELVDRVRRRWTVAVAAIVLAGLAAVPAGSLTGTGASPLRGTEAPLLAIAPGIGGHSVDLQVAPAFTPAPGTSLLGPVAPDAPLQVGVGLASRDPAGLAAWVAASATAGTPQHGMHLSATAAAERFGADPASVRAAESYFQGLGLTVRSNPDGLLLEVSGPSARIGTAFQTSFDLYRLPDGRTVLGHPTPATLPRIAAWTGALGLGNLTPIRPAVLTSAPLVRLTPAASCTGFTGDLLPCALQTAYEMNPLLANGTNGTGERVAVVDAYSGSENQTVLARDFASFASVSGLPSGRSSFLYPVPSSVSLNTSSTNPAWALEDALDFEWARAAAPGDSVEMTFSPDAGVGLYEAVDWLVAQGAADVISMSWGEPDVGAFNPMEYPCTFACNASTDGSYALLGPVLELAAAEGISVFAASGDCGASDGTAVASTEFPASDPYVTGVGGTILSLTPGYAWSSETGWSGNSSGATGNCTNGGGSGGGYSPFPRPAWQVGTGIPPSDQRRAVPDVSINAATYVTIVYQGFQSGVGGTSAGTPVWAGIAAVADQAAGKDLGLLNPSLYTILGGARYSTDFHDIQTGNNGYGAGVDWDPVTGIGTPRVSSLVADLARGGALAGGNLSIAITAVPQRGSAPLLVSFHATEAGGSGTYPLVGVSFGDGNASLTTVGNVTHTYASAGVYGAQGYVFDSRGNGSVSAPVPIVVGGGAMLSVTLSASSSAPAVGAVVTLNASVVGGTGPYSYDFTFGDGSFEANSSQATATHAYGEAGNFSAEVLVSDSATPENGGASAGVWINVGTPLTLTPIPGLPVRDAPADFPSLFVASGGTTGHGHPAPTLTLSSSDPYVGACDCAIFRGAGSYWINATAVDSGGDRASANASVTVAPPLAAQFVSTALAGPVPLNVTLSVTASGGFGTNTSETVWTSGTGTTLTGSSVQFTYSTPGQFVATGLLSDLGYGNASEAFLVDAQPASGTPPLGLTGTVTPARAIGSGQTVVLSATDVGNGSGAPGNAIVWTLGNGHIAYGPLVNETYWDPPALAGDTLDAAVAVQGPGESSLVRVPVDLPSFFANESGGFVPAVSSLGMTVATVTPSLGPRSLHVSVHAVASGPGGASVGWLFGDGDSSLIPNTTYVYGLAGRYNAEATATDPFGDQVVLTDGIFVTVPISIVGGPAPVSGTAPLAVAFSASAAGGVGGTYAYSWSFGDGSTATGAQANHTYSSPGTYVITVNVTDGAGEGAQDRWNVTVSAGYGYPVLIFLVGGAGAVIAVVAVLVWDRRSRRPFTP